MEHATITQENKPKTPIYQRFTLALQSDPRYSQEVALGRRIGFYRFCGDIGRGNFSRVKLAVHQLTKDKVAIKVVDTSRLDAKALRMLSREVTTLEAVFHPFILRLFEVIETLGKIHLVSEWIQGGELYNRITEIGPLEEYHAAIIFYQLLMAVKHLHSLGYVHRDIKAENVLMVSNERIKLADFGFSTQLINGSWQHLDTFCGSPPYAAPELFSDDHYIGGPVDVWALGVLLYFMLHGKMPFKASTVPLLRTAVLKGEFEISAFLSLSCCRVIERILVHTPSRRPTLEQLLNCQWFEYAQRHTNTKNTKQNCYCQENSEVPISRKKPFWRFSTKTNSRNYSPKQPSNHKNIAANQVETNVPTLRTIKCTTKRAGSVLDESFLNPIEINDPEVIHIKKIDSDITNASICNRKDSSIKNRRISLGRSVKKKISPVEQTSAHFNDEESHPKITEFDFKDRLQHIIEQEHGTYVMYPTLSGDMHPLEVETRKIMLNLGASSEMIRKSVANGPRSDIIGIYRIIIQRLQKEQMISCFQNDVCFVDYPKSQCSNYNEKNKYRKTKNSTTNILHCAIL